MKLLYWLRISIFLFSFSASALFFKLLLPRQEIPKNIYSLSSKLKYFAEHKDEYNIIFVGTSRTHNQISPKIFDQTLDSLYPLENQPKSFNFGLQGSRIITTYFSIDEILNTQPRNLRWIFVENLLDEGYSPIQNARNSRLIYFHDWHKTYFSVNYTLNSDNSFFKKFALASSHVIPFFFNFINLGLISDQFPLETELQSKLDEQIGTMKDGYIPLESNMENKNHAVFLKNTDSYLKSVEHLRKNPYTKVNLTSNRIEIVKKIVKRIRDYGAEPIFVIAPGIIRNDEVLEAYERGYIPTLFVYNDPNKYPMLYQIDNRFDGEHLNEKGSYLFSQLLAEDLAQYLKKLAE